MKSSIASPQSAWRSSSDASLCYDVVVLATFVLCAVVRVWRITVGDILGARAVRVFDIMLAIACLRERRESVAREW